jgi:hypothetical protein|tara:strand:+ start:652 stop:1572 length:921 start_codon:yes stop_codon:yes gene_type:complete
MKYKLYKEASEIVSNSIHIIGATRSGTTLFEQLISSLKNVECYDEPALLRVLLPLIGSIPKKEFQILFEAYLFEERMMYSIPGRNINLNKFDMSSIYNSKDKKEIESRLSKSYRRLEIFPKAIKSSIAFKQVEISQYLREFIDYYPMMRTILLIRSPEGVINSINQKKWFSDEQLFNNSGKWFFKRGTNWNIPDWLENNERKKFLKMNETDRALFYYQSEYKNFIKCLKLKKFKPLIIDYDDFTKNPDLIFSSTTKSIKENYGKLTNKILRSIRINSSSQKNLIDFDKKLLENCKKLYEICYSSII